MVSFQGTFEFFDDSSFLSPPSIYRPTPQIKTYPSHSLMGYIQQKHRKFAYIVQLAKLDWQMADVSFRGTLFVPQESAIPEEYLYSMDIQKARQIVKYHLMIGFFPQKALSTSSYQQLQTSIKGSTITAFWNQSILHLNISDTYIVQFDIILSNGIVHLLNQSLIPFT